MNPSSDLEEPKELQTEDELKEELCYRLRILQETAGRSLVGRFSPNMSLEKLQTMYQLKLARYKREQEEKEMAALKGLLVNHLAVSLEQRGYTLAELNQILDAKLLEAGISRTQLSQALGLMSILFLVTPH